MPTQLNPYISFEDNARQAMEFYQTVFGGELTVNTFADFQASDDPSEGDKVMHAMLVADSVVFMAADTPNSMEYMPGASISMSLSGTDESELRGYFDKLAANGNVFMPLEKAPWGDIFGMCVDQFGVKWMANITAAV